MTMDPKPASSQQAKKPLQHQQQQQLPPPVAPGMPQPTQQIPPKSSVIKTDKPRPHVCITCTRSFARLEHLKRHERSHTKEKPFQCPVCERCFARRDLLLRHKQKLHASFPETPRVRATAKRKSVSVAKSTANKAAAAAAAAANASANQNGSSTSKPSPGNSESIVQQSPLPHPTAMSPPGILHTGIPSSRQDLVCILEYFLASTSPSFTFSFVKHLLLSNFSFFPFSFGAH